ncbi:hypothetical protein CsSME_00005538 [Camellia sinensis var. sinensis]
MDKNKNRTDLLAAGRKKVFLDPFDVNFNLTQNFLLQAMSLNCYLHFFVFPRYALDDMGSGSHVHLSLCQS